MLRLGREPSIRAMGMSTMRRMLQGKTRYAAGNRRSLSRLGAATAGTIVTRCLTFAHLGIIYVPL